MKVITVEACEGKTVVFPRSTIVGPDRSHPMLRGDETPTGARSEDGELLVHEKSEPMKVRETRFVRMRIAAGDLRVVPAPKPVRATMPEAAVRVPAVALEPAPVASSPVKPAKES